MGCAWAYVLIIPNPESYVLVTARVDDLSVGERSS